MKRLLPILLIFLLVFGCAFAEASDFIGAINEQQECFLGEGETITSITLNENKLTVIIDLSKSVYADMYPASDFGLARIDSLTDLILNDLSDYESLWEEIEIILQEVGEITLDKTFIVDNPDYGRYMDWLDTDFHLY